jgi:hypothetical protein
MEAAVNNNAGVWKGVRYTLLTIVALIAIWVWYVNNNYSVVFNNNFMKSCTAQGGDESGCKCALDAFKDNYSFKDAKKIEKTGVYPDELLSVITARCSS